MGDSHFWTSLLKVKDIFYQHCKKVIGDGKNIRFGEDWWVGDKSLKFSYPRLYNLLAEDEKDLLLEELCLEKV